MKAEALSVDVVLFKQMREEWVLPKRLGRVSYDGTDNEPFTLNEKQVLTKLIKETAVHKDAAYASDTWKILSREIQPLRMGHPILMKDKVKEEKLIKADRNSNVLSVTQMGTLHLTWSHCRHKWEQNILGGEETLITWIEVLYWYEQVYTSGCCHSTQ